MGSHHLVLPWIRPYLLSMFPTNPLQHRYPCSAHTIGYRHDGQISVPGGSSLWIFVLFPTLLHSYKDTKKSLKALFLYFQTFLQGTHIEPVVTHFEPLSLSLWSLNHSSMMSRYGVTIEVLRFATGGWGEKSSWLRYLRTVLRSKPVRDEIFEIEYPFWLKSLISLIWDIVSISFPPLPLVVLRQRISDRLFCFNMSLSDFEEFPFWYWGILSPISGTFIIRYTRISTWRIVHPLLDTLPDPTVVQLKSHF